MKSWTGCKQNRKLRIWDVTLLEAQWFQQKAGSPPMILSYTQKVNGDIELLRRKMLPVRSKIMKKITLQMFEPSTWVETLGVYLSPDSSNLEVFIKTNAQENRKISLEPNI